VTLPEPPLRILVIGATGLIGSAVSARLHANGHKVTGLARRPPAESLFIEKYVAADLTDVRTEQAWRPLLNDIDAVINCAGVLQDGLQDSTAAVHANSIGTLFRACGTVGIQKVIHLSAIGVDRETPTEFSRTKIEGDEILMGIDLDWVILRPSVVVGRPAYGGSALFRALAVLPIFPDPPQAGLLQIVQLDELVDTVVFFLGKDAPARITLDVAGPERLSFTQIVLIYRKWFGLRPATVVNLPRWFAFVMYRMGNLAGWLGWRPPIRSNAATEMGRGAIGDNTNWIETTRIKPRSLVQALEAEPASVQEKWFSRLYLLKPLVVGIFALFWIVTGIISFGPGWKIGMDLMRRRCRRNRSASDRRRRFRRYPHWRRHSLPAHGADFAMGCSFFVDRLCRHRHYSRTASLGRPARPDAENMAYHGLQSGRDRNPR
jgi:uncharacterized protein YbjT (DUF2867 family)